MSEPFLVLICNNPSHRFHIYVRGNWWHKQTMNIVVRLVLEITVQCLWGTCKAVKAWWFWLILITQELFSNRIVTSQVPESSRNYFGLCLQTTDQTIDQTIKHNRNIYTKSGTSSSNSGIPSPHTLFTPQSGVCVYTSTHTKARWLAVCFLFWCLCTHFLLVQTVCVTDPACCCDAARQEQCVATGKMLSLN